MKLNFDQIQLKKKVYVEKGQIELKKHQITLVTGKNGTGKTLLLSFLAEVYQDHMTLVSQKNNEILAKLTTEENITLTVKDVTKRETFMKLLRRFECEYLLDKRPKKLSGGEKRILSLIRGLSSDAPLLMIDEPTNDLDYKKVATLLMVLQEMSAEKTFLIVTHDDRLTKIAHAVYQIAQRQLTKIKQADEGVSSRSRMENFILESVDKNRLKHNRIQKIFNYNLIYLPIIILFAIFTYFMLMDTNREFMNEIPPINPNQIEIFSPITIYQERIPEALPIGIFELIDHQASLFPNRQEVEQFIEEFLEQALTFTLQFEATESFRVFPIEFWSQNRLIFTSPGEIYLRELLDDNYGRFYLDTSAYFKGDWNFNFGASRVAFNAAYYERSVDLLMALYDDELDPLRMTYVVLLLNEDLDFFEFMSSAYMEHLVNGSFFIRSNEIIDIINQVHFYAMLEELRFTAMGISLLIFMIQVAYAYLYLKLMRKEFTILRNYGFKHKWVKKKFNKKFGSSIVTIAVSILLFLINVWLIRRTALDGMWVAYFPGIASAIAITMANHVTKLMSSLHLKKIYKWHTR